MLIEQLLAIRYKYNKEGLKIIEPKEKMYQRVKKENPNAKWKSPDRADALMMAVYYADYVMSADFNDRFPAYGIANDQVYAGLSSRLPENYQAD